MPIKPLPEAFWTIYDLARERAENDPIWNQCEMQRMFVLEQSNVPDDYEEILYTANEQQMILIIHEFYQILVGEKSHQ